MQRNLMAIFACAGALVAAQETAARADTNELTSYAWRAPGMAGGIGIGVQAGGGVSGFTDKTMRDSTSSSVGGLWNLRVTIGTHVPIGLDIAYVGTAAGVQTLAKQDNGNLVGTELEAAVRFNILPHYEWNPYVFAGIGYQRYDLTSVKLEQADSGMASDDTLAVFPLGGGIQYRDRSGVVLDARGSFSPATSSDLVLEKNGTDHAPVHSWSAGATLGYEF